MHRILAGQQLYPAPSVGYVPDGYPPLYFAVSAAAPGVLGPSYLPLRLVSLVSSLACFALLGRLVQRETGSTTAGIAAAGMLAATYFVTGTWFDVGRVDSLFLALSVGALYAARWMRGTRGAVAARGAACRRRPDQAERARRRRRGARGAAARPAPRLAVPAALTYGRRACRQHAAARRSPATAGTCIYVFEQMSEQSLKAAAIGQFWTIPCCPRSACRGMRGRTRRAADSAGAARGLRRAAHGRGYAALVHGGGTVNDLLPAYLAVALLAGLAMGGQPGGLVADGLDRLARPRLANWRAGRAGHWVAALASGLVIVQLAVLVSGFRPARAIPATAGRAVGIRLTAGVRALGGTVAVPADPGLDLHGRAARRWRTRARSSTCCGPPTRPRSRASGGAPHAQ